ncbi:MAG: hypothetical protein ACYS32_04170 [Planctomycetota bacterium]|jgi:hypothetical protein
MKVNGVIQKFLSLIFLSALFLGLAVAKESEKSSITFRSLKVAPGFSKTRADTIGRAITFKDWAQTETLRFAPVINKSLLSNPELVTRQSTSYTEVQFGQEPWGKSRCSWDCLIKDDKDVAAELPASRKKKLLAQISAEKRRDKAFVDRYMKRKLARYRKSKKYRLDGQMYVEVVLAPSSRAAQEYLLTSMTENTMPTEDLAKIYASAKGREQLGNVSFLTESQGTNDIHIRFTRDNICLNIRANGTLGVEALPLARKIDAEIARQAVFTYQQLLAQRPSVTIGTKPDAQMKTVSCNVSAAAGQKIVRVEASIDGQSAVFEDMKIHLLAKKGLLKVKLTAITQQLLANSFERQLVVE